MPPEELAFSIKIMEMLLTWTIIPLCGMKTGVPEHSVSIVNLFDGFIAMMQKVTVY